MAVHNLKILQLNCQRSESVMYDLGQWIIRYRFDICLLQEPYIFKGKLRGIPLGMIVSISRSGRAGIVVPSGPTECMFLGEIGGDDCVSVLVKGFFGKLYLSSSYCGYDVNMNDTLVNLDRICMRFGREKMLIGMDANASNLLWHSKGRMNGSERWRRGNILEDWILTNDSGIYVTNEPSEYFSFSGPMGESDINVSLSNISDWVFSLLIKHDSGISDHNPSVMVFDLNTVENVQMNELPYWIEKDVNWVVYEQNLYDRANELSVNNFMDLALDEKINLLSNWTTKTNDECMKKRKVKVINDVRWWNDNMESLKSDVRRARKKYQRARKRDCERAECRWREWIECVKIYKKSMKEAKTMN